MIAVLSQGCAANFGEGEKIARILSKNSEITFNFIEKRRPQSELIEAFYLNVCTVKGNAGALKLLRKVSETYPDKPIYITGCAPKDFRTEAQKISPSVKFTNLHELESEAAISSTTSTVAASAAAVATTITASTTATSASAVKQTNVLRESPFIGIVNIEEGCLDACAFCSTHLVKGRLKSFNSDFIIEQVQALVDDGCYEIQLTGQDCACYGFDIGTNLAELTQKILLRVSGNYHLRLGMGNPRHVQSYKEALLDTFTDERVYKFLHLPVQSGSENVLRAMNRRHSVQDYTNLAHELAKRYPHFTLSTDLIVGHPGESESDFQNTLELLKDTRPTVCNITRFVARPGTVAFQLEQTATAVPDTVKHERSARLAEAFQKIALENNSEFIGKKETIVIEKCGYRPGTMIARNSAYRPVALQGTYPIGEKLQVRITTAEPFALIAEPILP